MRRCFAPPIVMGVRDLPACNAINRIAGPKRRSPIRRLRVASAVTLSLATLFVLPRPAGASNAPQAWLQAAPLPAGFTPRWDAAYAAFPPKKQIVLFGGAPAAVGDPWWNDTWIYTTTTGTWSTGPVAPPGLTPRGGGAMAYDPAIGKIVLFGGAVENNVTPPHGTWLFDGTSWSKGPAVPKAMSGRVGARMAYLPNQRKLVLFGGSGAIPLNDTWFFDGTEWTPGPAAPAGLDPRVFFGMAYDASIGKIVVVGGDGSRTVWYFGGAKWTRGPDLPATVGGRDRMSLAYDPQLGGTVLFGGLGPAPANRSVYILRDGAWSYLTVPGLDAPSGRLDPGLLWDDASKSLVVVGGIKNADNGKTGFSETWKLVSPPVAASP